MGLLQSTDFRKHKIAIQSVFSNDLKFGVVVAESNSQHILQVLLTGCARSLLKTLALQSTLFFC